MKTKCVCIAAGVVMLTVSSHAALTSETGYLATQIYSSDTGIPYVNGLDLYNGRLYTADYLNVTSMDTDGNNVSTLGELNYNAGVSLVSVNSGGTVYTSYGTSYSSPYPYSIGYVSGGSYNEQATYDGIYDAARNNAGDMFINANPNAAGAGIYKYSELDGSFFEIAILGGSSSGLAFDSLGNLYCSLYDENKVISFTSAQIAGVLDGGNALTVSDAASEIALAGAGYLAFGTDDQLYATYLDDSWNTHIVALDSDGSTTAIASGGGKLVVDGDLLYTVDNDWDTYEGSIYRIAAVPEPSSVLLLLLGSLGITGYRRYFRKV